MFITNVSMVLAPGTNITDSRPSSGRSGASRKLINSSLEQPAHDANRCSRLMISSGSSSVIIALTIRESA
jgi:hypothetical protein